MENPSLSQSFIRKTIITTGVALGLSLALAYLLVRFGIQVIVSFVIIITLFFFVFYEIKRNKSGHKVSLLVVLLVASLPLQNIFLITYPLKAAAQLSIPFVILFLWAKSSQHTRYEYIRSIKPLIFPTAFFVSSFLLSYSISGKIQNKDWSFLLNLIGVVGYAYLACFCCNSLDNLKKILWVFIGIGVIQLPVMYAMGRGWTQGLPGVLAGLNNSSWGGAASSYNANALRYPGLFSDYELLAEFLDLTALFCVGIFIYTSSQQERVLSLAASCLILIAGFFTGTRTFIVGIGIGFICMLVLFVIRQGFGTKVKYFLIIAILFSLGLALLSTQEVFRAYIQRFLQTDIRLGFYDTRNIVWTISFSMIQRLPFTGYGTQMMDVFDTVGNGIWVSPHSLYLSMLLTAGIPGLIAVISFIGAPFLWVFQIVFRRNTKQYHAWAIVLISVWVFWAINEVKIEFLRRPFYMNIVFFIYGILASFFYLAHRNEDV